MSTLLIELAQDRRHSNPLVSIRFPFGVRWRKRDGSPSNLVAYRRTFGLLLRGFAYFTTACQRWWNVDLHRRSTTLAERRPWTIFFWNFRSDCLATFLMIKDVNILIVWNIGVSMEMIGLNIDGSRTLIVHVLWNNFLKFSQKSTTRCHVNNTRTI